MDSSTLSSFNNRIRFGDVFGGLRNMFIVCIIACVCSSVKGTQNVALGKSAYQSGTDWGGVPGRAVDGNTNGLFGHNSCSHTYVNAEAWWKVDLGDVYVIDHVTLYNRLDCCGDWLDNVQLLIGLDESDYVLHGSHAGVIGTSYTFQLQPNVYGRWVKITRIPVEHALVLCEVLVMGSDIATANFLKLKQVEDVIGTGVLLDTSQASSVIMCCFQCQKTPRCVAINYNSATGTCATIETLSTTSDSNESNYFYRLN